jgi:polysaccharide deacetylase 2 family uncharacterized protein YibQ
MTRARLVRVAGEALLWFWIGVLVVAVGGAATVFYLGPPGDAGMLAQAPAGPKAIELTPGAEHMSGQPAAVADVSQPEPARLHAVGAKATVQAGRAEPPGTIAAVDSALEEPAKNYLGASLPRAAPDGRAPMQVYARGFDPADRHPRIGLLVSGFGLNAGLSSDAIRTLPGAVTLAISPYAIRPEPMLEEARAAGHEFLISLPMEPQGYPLNSEGPHMMLSESRPEDNRLQLEWALSRVGGYAGATGALDGLRGERFPQMADQFNDVLSQLAARGLLYVDSRPSAPNPPHVFGRAIDLVVDEPPTHNDIVAKLGMLEQIARQKGTALGLAGPPRPVTVETVTAWANGLAAKDLALAPVSALVQAPAPEPTAKK